MSKCLDNGSLATQRCLHAWYHDDLDFIQSYRHFLPFEVIWKNLELGCSTNQDGKKYCGFSQSWPNFLDNNDDKSLSVNKILDKICNDPPDNISDDDAIQANCRPEFFNGKILSFQKQVDYLPTDHNMALYNHQFISIKANCSQEKIDQILGSYIPDDCLITENDLFVTDGWRKVINSACFKIGSSSISNEAMDRSEVGGWLLTEAGVTIECSPGSANVYGPTVSVPWSALSRFMKPHVLDPVEN